MYKSRFFNEKTRKYRVLKILYVTTVGATMGFFQSFIKELLEDGHIVEIACNYMESPVPECYRDWGCGMYQLPCSRSPLAGGNLKAVMKIKQLVEKKKYDIVHCHTPIAAVCTRFACRKNRNHMKVIYTAHGFHFYSGAPLKNWLLYYPVEWLCSWWTDVLITINREDYSRAKKRFHAGQVCYIPGVGADISRFKIKPEYQKENGKKELGVPEDALLLVSVGELNLNKNHQVVIRAIAELNDEKIHYVIAGKGSEYGNLKNLSDELGIAGQIHLLGYRNDIEKIYAASDICVFPSIREGLGLAAIEGMAAGLPLIVSDNRGARDFAVNMKNALICNPQSVSEFANAIVALKDRNMRAKFGERNLIISEKFSMEKTNKKMKRIYSYV